MKKSKDLYIENNRHSISKREAFGKSRRQWFTHCGPQTTGISNTWTLAKNASSQAPP